MNEEEIIASIALTKIRGLGSTWALRLIRELGDAVSIFEKRKDLKDLIPDLNDKIINLLDDAEAYGKAAKEYEFVKKNHLYCYTYNDEHYPSRLRECEDAPILLYCQGHADLNKLHMVSMVGTRHCTDYGKTLCLKFLNDLHSILPNLMIVSGLAYGVDINAHRAALSNRIPTVAVLAHGLDRIYPSMHRDTAFEMCGTGGLLTEFPSGTNPDRQNFVMRNRIVAGMCDATIVVESAAKGGSLITADLATGYGRDCFAFPGQVDAPYSSGCNNLIRDNKAALISNAEDFVKLMGWTSNLDGEKACPIQRELFIDLSPEENIIVELLRKEGKSQINTLVVKSNIPVNKLSSLLFELELKGVVRSMAGSVYQLL